jgi:hypothetical protein
MASYEPMLSDVEAEHLIRDTEREILFDALGQDLPEEAMPSDLINDQSRVEGWDGALDDSELIHTTAFGHEQHGFDRPLQFREEQDAVTENARLQQELAQRDQQIQQLLDQTGPIREAREQQQQQRRDALLNAAVDPEQADQLLNTLEGQQQQIHAQTVDRANAAMEATKAEYGPEFDRAYAQVQRGIQRLHRSDPRRGQEILRDILGAPHPGEAIFAYANDPRLQIGTGTGGNPAPFMPGQRAAPASNRSRNVGYDDLVSDDGSNVRADMEQDIFRSAVR